MKLESISSVFTDNTLTKVKYRIRIYKTSVGRFIIKSALDTEVFSQTIYRDPDKGTIVAGLAVNTWVPDGVNFTLVQETGVIIIYPDKTRRLIKNMSVNEAVQKFIFKS